MKTKRLLQTAALGGALVSATANAQLEIPKGQYWDSGSEDFRAVLAFPMLWAPEINLNIEAGELDDIEVTIPFKDILTNLGIGFMGEFYLNYKWFGFVLKGMYMDLRPDTISESLGGDIIGLDLDVDVGLRMGMYDIGLSWNLWRNLRLFTLGRVTQVDVTVEVEGNVSASLPDGAPAGCNPNRPFPLGCLVDPGTEIGQDFEGKADVEPDDMWDYMLGLQYSWWMGQTKRHGINLYGDVAVGGDSDSAWQIDVRYMYRVSKLNNFWLGWRTYQSVTEEDDNGHATTINLNGPLAGWAFSF